MLIRLGKARYAWVTALPAAFMIPVTMSAGYLNITRNYLPPGKWLLVALSAVLMVLMAVVFVEAFVRWSQLLRIRERITDRYGRAVIAEVEE
jgi:carbon starvation protein